MPSPFPGMDPYLEKAGYWRGFHNNLITFIGGLLNTVLPEGFAADTEERVFVVPPQRSIYPDVLVAWKPLEPVSTSRSGGTAVAERSAEHGLLTVLEDEHVRERFIEIRRTDGEGEVVAVIEILSPTNKAADGEGRTEYLRKQTELLSSPVHLLEIDLLRSGQHTVAAPYEALRQRGNWDYLVCLHRGYRSNEYEYWFNRLQEPLPVVTVPLLEGIAEVELDLQTAFNQAYDAGPYKRFTDYRQEPVPPLNEENAAWADVLLREKGNVPA